MATTEKCMNQFLDDFTKWRKHKGYEDFATMAEKRPTEIGRKWQQDFEEYKSERHVSG